MTDLHFIPECYIDTNLTETLLNGVEVNHQKGCGTVASRMEKQFGDDFAVGIIDKDKQEIDYLKAFTAIAETNGLILHKHRTRHHYIIQIVPAMERFIVDAMAEAGLDKADFGIPDDMKKLTRLTKTINRKTDPHFKKLFKTLVKHDALRVLVMKRWLHYLREKRYKADSNELLALTG